MKSDDSARVITVLLSQFVLRFAVCVFKGEGLHGEGVRSEVAQTPFNPQNSTAIDVL